MNLDLCVGPHDKMTLCKILDDGSLDKYQTTYKVSDVYVRILSRVSSFIFLYLGASIHLHINTSLACFGWEEEEEEDVVVDDRSRR